MLGGVTEFLRDRLRRRSALIPAGYTWSFVLMVDTALVLIVLAAILQRTRADLPAAGLAGLIAVSPLVLFFLAGVRFLPALVWVTSYAAATILIFATATPIKSDVAPTLLVLTVGCVGSLAPVVYGTVALGSAVALLAAASAAHRLDELVLYSSMLLLGWVVGVMTRVQARLLVQQQELQADLARHAAADERRRIAREVHDVIAHSLSVTLLHVTGARRALEQDRDVGDAVDALIDAERLGRQAMADIRRTVGLLETGPTGTTPEPGIGDIGDLINDFASAGLPVTLRAEGHQDRVSPAVGLALYRIVQESLANVAKHAPESEATVDLTVSPSTVRLSIVNEVPGVVRASSGDGRGLVGMRERVELLGGVIDAGPCPTGWSVCAEIPLTDPSPARCSR